jgi:hypothetical protein
MDSIINNLFSKLDSELCTPSFLKLFSQIDYEILQQLVDSDLSPRPIIELEASITQMIDNV